MTVHYAINTTMSVAAIGGRTDSSGVGVTDFTAEEARLPAYIFEPGYVEPTSAFQVTAGTPGNMTVVVGSGVAKTDVYVVGGTIVGQGNYIVRLDATSVGVTLTAAHGSQTRIDEIYLVVKDNTYDSSGYSLPQIGYSEGTPGGGNPGVSSAWKAYELLARITVPAGATEVTDAMISDERQATQIKTALFETPANTLYYTKAETASLLAAKSSTSHGHDPIGSVMTGTDRAWVAADSNGQAQTIGDHVATRVAFPGIRVGSAHVGWASSFGGHHFTFNTAGLWSITCTVKFKRLNNSPGERILRFQSDLYGSQEFIAGSGAFSTGAPVTCNVSFTGWFAAGKYLFVDAYTDADFNLELEGDIATHNIQLVLLRRAT